MYKGVEIVIKDSLSETFTTASSLYEGAIKLFSSSQEFSRVKDLSLTTIFSSIEKNLEIANYIKNSNSDICCHGYRWTEHFMMKKNIERNNISKAFNLIFRLTNKKARGWYCRYAPSENTRELLVQNGNFIYDSDAYNDDLPYWVKVNKKKH